MGATLGAGTQTALHRVLSLECPSLISLLENHCGCWWKAVCGDTSEGGPGLGIWACKHPPSDSDGQPAWGHPGLTCLRSHRSYQRKWDLPHFRECPTSGGSPMGAGPHLSCLLLCPRCLVLSDSMYHLKKHPFLMCGPPTLLPLIRRAEWWEDVGYRATCQGSDISPVLTASP